LAVTRTYRLDLRAVDTLRGGPPLILAPNHPALIDALLILTAIPTWLRDEVGAHEECVLGFGFTAGALCEK